MGVVAAAALGGSVGVGIITRIGVGVGGVELRARQIVEVKGLSLWRRNSRKKEQRAMTTSSAEEAERPASPPTTSPLTSSTP